MAYLFVVALVRVEHLKFSLPPLLLDSMSLKYLTQAQIDKVCGHRLVHSI